MFKRYYLAYGSNLNLNEMKARCSSARKIGTTILNDYRLVYKGSKDEEAFLTIEQAKDSSVPLGIFELSIKDIVNLDRYEGYPFLYSKKYILIKIGNKTVKALVYIMNDNFDYHLPSEEYVLSCIEGYEDFGFDKTILNKALIDTKENLPKIKR